MPDFHNNKREIIKDLVSSGKMVSSKGILISSLCSSSSVSSSSITQESP
jgi:hypothetical protein